MNNWQEKQQQVHYYILILLATTLPFSLYIISNVLIILLGLNWLVKIVFERRIAFEKTDQIIVVSSIVFFFLYLIGVIYSSNKHDAWSSVERKLPLLFLPLIVASFPVLEGRRIKVILTAFLISCTCISILCVVYTFWLNKQLGIEFVYYNNYQFSEENLIRKFGFHHVYLSMYLCFCQVIITYLFSTSKKVYLKIGLLIIGIFLFLFMLALASRMGIIILIVLTSLLVFLLVKRSFLYKASLFSGVVILVIVIGYQFPFIREKFTGVLNIDVNQYSKMYLASNRMVSIISTWDIFKANWILGVGTGDVNDLLMKEYERVNFQEGLIHVYNPHNQYLDTAGTIGIFGLVALISILLVPLYRSFKDRDFIGISFSVIMLFSLLTESMLSRQKGVVFFALFLCLLNVHGKGREPIMKF